MPRISGVNVSGKKHAWIALTAIYGVGRSRAYEVLAKLKIDANQKMDDISDTDIDRIREELKNYLIEGDLRREKTGNIKLLQEINCYRGIRHRKRLPVRGQRTKTNARTRKGKSVAIAGKKK